MLKKWVRTNLEIGALSFGSSGRAMLYHDAAVNKNNWITQNEFQETFTLSQILPGPNLLNLSTYIGYRVAGPLATILGVFALTVPGLILLLLIEKIIGDNQPEMITVFFRGISIGSVALFFLLIKKMLLSLFTQSSKKPIHLKNILRFALVSTIGAFSMFHFPLSLTLLSGFALGLVIEFLF